MKLKILLLVWLAFVSLTQAETLAPLADRQAPQTMEELWAGFDPLAEPLETEVLHEWEEEGVILRVVRFRVGVFKGKKAMLAGVYGFPKGGKNLPGLLNIHGGGQYADYRAPLTNAKRGYATLTIAWAGRISSPKHTVRPEHVKAFWSGDSEDPNYRVTTDWGALDAYHAPSKNGKDAFVSIRGEEDWTLDPIESPRNNSWFLCALGTRRGLTFLQRQPEVDGERLGVYGHSMGGKLTVLTSGSDSRVKACAPSCGGISDRYNDLQLHRNTVGDSPYLKNMSCPVVMLMPANDFHSHVNDLVRTTQELGDNEWRITSSAHISHKDMPQNEVATQLWFDEHLKGTFQWPETPKTQVIFDTPTGAPRIRVVPDTSREILGVDVYYTQQGRVGGDRSWRQNRINRFWHHGPTTQNGDAWIAHLLLHDVEKPLWVYANVLYKLDEPVTGAGYYYGSYTANSLDVSSLIELYSAEDLQKAGAKAHLKPRLLIEDFQGDWRKEWFSASVDPWRLKTHKVYHPMWKAPEGGSLLLEVGSEKANTLVIGIDTHAAEIPLPGGSEPQKVILTLADFKNQEGTPLASWDGIQELRLNDAEHLRSTKDRSQTRVVGKPWQGADPVFKKLQWIQP